jgi:hypothetical protein
MGMWQNNCDWGKKNDFDRWRPDFVVPLSQYIFLLSMKRLFIGLFVMSGLSFSLGAQEGKWSVEGAVTDGQGEAVVSATVILKQADRVVTGAISDSAGHYVVGGLEGGEYELHVSFIGYETHVEAVSIGANRSLATVTLKEVSSELGEVSVTGRRKSLQVKGSSIVVGVENSSLSRETDVTEILRKIPGMTLSRGELTSFTGWKPAIYINGKRIQSMNEVNQLAVKDIKTVELNTNPGSRYDASVDAVLLITTRRREEGWSMQLDGEWAVNHRLSNVEAVKINYNHEGLNIFASLGYDDSRRKSHQRMQAGVSAGDTVWRQGTTIVSEKNSIRMYTFSAGADYAAGAGHSLGVKYDGAKGTFYDRSPYGSEVYANGRPFASLTGASTLRNADYDHHVNAYYKGRLTEKADVNVYTDYVRSNKDRNQVSHEESAEYGTADIVNDNVSAYVVYAATSELNYAPGEQSQLAAGVSWSRVEGENELTYTGGVAEDSKTRSTEAKVAGYASWTYRNDPFSLEAGLRYEHVRYAYRDVLNRTNDIDRDYTDFFPNVSVSHAGRALRQSLNYRMMTTRPSFNLLGNYTAYLNRFMYQTGNPGLQPQISHRVRYSAFYRFIYLTLGYVYNSDYIGSYFYSAADNASTVIYSWRNFDRQQQLNATVNLHYRFGIYEPSLTGMFMKNIQQAETSAGTKTIDKPFLIATLNNALHLPGGFFLNVEYQYQSAGSRQIFLFRPTHVFGLNLSKSFWKEALQVNVKVNDVFRKNISRYEGEYGNITFRQTEDQDRRNVTLHVVYRFNNFSKKYKGESAAENEMNRLR